MRSRRLKRRYTSRESEVPGGKGDGSKKVIPLAQGDEGVIRERALISTFLNLDNNLNNRMDNEAAREKAVEEYMVRSRDPRKRFGFGQDCECSGRGTEAAIWYCLAAEQGNKDAHSRLAEWTFSLLGQLKDRQAQVTSPSQPVVAEPAGEAEEKGGEKWKLWAERVGSKEDSGSIQGEDQSSRNGNYKKRKIEEEAVASL